MSGSPLRWYVYSNGEELISAVIQTIATRAEHAIASSGRFLIVLAGGSTPRLIYAKLSDFDLAWSQWHVYFGDERCFPVGHPERNDVMAREAWLNHVPIPQTQIHSIPAEAGPEAGAEMYARELADVGTFDLTLLGLGTDGHTASLFPGHPTGCESTAPDVLAVRAAPKPPSSRVTLSAARLGRSHTVLLIVVGKEKRKALMELRDGADLPIRSIQPSNGVDVLVDRSATPADIV